MPIHILKLATAEKRNRLEALVVAVLVHLAKYYEFHEFDCIKGGSKYTPRVGPGPIAWSLQPYD